jgi:uncharacterized hydrophobic protein (TIGR00271 family)
MTGTEPASAAGRFRHSVSGEDIDRMTDKLFITGGSDAGRKTSAFWVLLILAAIIASAGVVSDSTATVIGAMIVAPLMTPILGFALAIALANRGMMVVNALLVLAGAGLVVVIGYLVGLTHHLPVVASTSSQVASRINPRLIDLLAALATGVVGAFALVRSDVSDAIPGVAIAISLVPPLTVVGLTLESGAPDQSRGALLLFATNVAAIIATGTVVLLLYRVREAAQDSGREVGVLRSRTIAVVIGMVVLVAVPLVIGTVQVLKQEQTIAQARPVVVAWAATRGWTVTNMAFQQNELQIAVMGQPPEANTVALRSALDDAGLSDVDVAVTLTVGGTVQLPPTPNPTRTG